MAYITAICLGFCAVSHALYSVDCRRVWSMASPILQPELVADSPEVELQFINELRKTLPALADALAHHDHEETARRFQMEDFRSALERELKGLETGMAFSMLRQNFEGFAFAVQENDLIESWSHPDILYFSPGHGSPGGHHSVAASPTVTIERGGEPHVAEIRLKLFMPGIWETVSKSPAAKKAKAIFYATCNAGLSEVKNGELFYPAASELARRTQRPVVAPMGALIQLVTTKTPSVLVYTSVSRKGKGESKILPEDEAFQLFTPDGEGHPITFKEAMSLVAQPTATNQYVNTWNSVD